METKGTSGGDRGENSEAVWRVFFVLFLYADPNRKQAQSMEIGGAFP